MQDTNNLLEEQTVGTEVLTASETPTSTTIWQELDTWAQNFPRWKKFILIAAIRTGKLSEQQIEEAYSLFLHDNQLSDSVVPYVEIPETITGRPTMPSSTSVQLVSIRNLRSVNALPSTVELTFSNGLTIIYGGNGVGKSGIVRILSHACFSRTQQAILPNVYAQEATQQQPSADIVIKTGSQEKQISFILGDSSTYADLKRISIFDTAVARTHLIDQSPIGFKPIGFDVFPEMGRVYGLMSTRLSTDISQRSRDNIFTKSFVGAASPTSRFIASLNAESDIVTLRELATFGNTEQARVIEIQRQIKELLSQSAELTIKQLEEAKLAIISLQKRLTQSSQILTEEKRSKYRAQLDDFGKKIRAAAEHGIESFGSDSIENIGSPEWEAFLLAAQKLANIESSNYPQKQDQCLLCNRPLDDTSINLIRRFWNFLRSDLKRQVEEVSTTIDGTIKDIEALNFGFFSEDSAVRLHVERLNPSLTKKTCEFLQILEKDRMTIITVLKNGSGDIPSATFGDLTILYANLINQIDIDITRLKEHTSEAAIKSLEEELNSLEHKRILSQLLPDIESYINDLAWIKKALDLPKRSLNPRPITDKETELFSTLIAGSYRNQLSKECKLLECNLPIELKTKGDRGQTLKSLSIRGGYSPEKILSEGEQRAVALADFLTEVSLNPTNAGIIVDDPVTSQDHERKENIAKRLVVESQKRQVIVFTHDLVFLTMLAAEASEKKVEILTHWIERNSQGQPGQVSLDDCPASTPQYRNTNKAAKTLTEAKAATGSKRVELIQRGMGELRRTVEEIIPHFLFKQVINRWTDRIIVTGLKKINWDDELVKNIIHIYEELSAIIEGHTHTEEKMGAPPEPKNLEDMIGRVNDLIRQAKPDR